jgi:hypothetical protein
VYHYSQQPGLNGVKLAGLAGVLLWRHESLARLMNGEQHRQWLHCMADQIAEFGAPGLEETRFAAITIVIIVIIRRRRRRGRRTVNL